MKANWNQMHFYWKSCHWSPLPGTPQREDSLETRDPASVSQLPVLSLQSTNRWLLPYHSFSVMFLYHWKMGVLKNVSIFFHKSSCLWNREAILRANLLWTQRGSVFKANGKLHRVGVSAIYCWANSMVWHWPWQWNEPQEGHYSFLSQFTSLGHKMGEPKVKNVCYQVGRKDRYRDEVQRKVKGVRGRGRWTLSNTVSFKILRPSSSC